MINKVNIGHLELAYDLIKNMQQDEFAYIFNGFFSEKVSSQILTLTEANLNRTEDSYQIRKKVFFVLVECMQNITRHQRKDADKNPVSPGIIIIQKRADHYLVSTGNIMDNDKKDILEGLLEKINKLSKPELDEYYQDILVHGKISERGGAGLGLLSIARKTRQRYEYLFDKADNNKTYFYIQTAIPVDKTSTTDYLADAKNSLVQIKALHTILAEEKILLNFNGAFNNDNVNVLVALIQEHMKKKASVEDTLFGVMAEMLQNIVKYSEKSKETFESELDGNPGIFFLGENCDVFYLTAGNYIANDKIETLRRKLDFVNFLPKERLHDFHFQISAFFTNGEINKPDLSIIQMKLWSEHNLHYYFKKVSDKMSFFTLQTIVNKSQL